MPLKTLARMMGKNNVTAAIGLLLALAIGVVIALGGNTIVTWRQKALGYDTAKAQAQTTVGVAQDGTKATQRAAKVDDAVAKGETVYLGEMEEARNDPPTRVVLDTAVPSRVQQALRARRLARERSGGVPGEHAADAGEAEAAER